MIDTRQPRRSPGALRRGLLLLALFGLSACGGETVANSPNAGYAQAPGVYFHNDVAVFGAAGFGSARR